MRLQPPEHQLYFAKTPILDLGAPTPKDYNQLPSSNLNFGEAPTSKAPTLFCQDTNLGLRSTNSQGLQSFLLLRHQPQGLLSFLLLRNQPQGLLSFLLLRHQPQGLQSFLLVKIHLIVLFCSQNSSLLSSVYLQLHCSLQTTISMTISLRMNESLQLYALPMHSLQ